MSLKEKLMNKMMDGQFKSMNAEDKQQMMDNMMDKFFGSMSDEEKKEMMSGMMPKMMGQMMGDNPMMGMMSMMMGKKDGSPENAEGSGKMPWEKCGDMMTNFTETANTARFATPELRGLFNEWCDQIESEVLEFIKQEKGVNIDNISKKIQLSEESVKYLLNNLASKNLIEYKID
jgi:predicted transcriptional regulator